MISPLNSKTYDRLKFFTQIFLPALGTLYFALAGIWGLPAAEQVVGTVLAVDTFLGVVLQLSSNAYQNSDERFSGAIHVGEENEESGMQNFRVELPLRAQDVLDKDEVVLKVNQF